MESIVIWTAYLFGGLALLHLPTQIHRWMEVRRLYGGIPWSIVRQIWYYCRKTKALGIYYFIFIATLFYTVPVGLHLSLKLALPDFDLIPSRAHSAFIPALLCLFWQLERLAGYVLPPSVLLLGKSRSENVHLLAVLNNRLRRNRVVSLLNWNEHIFPLYASRFANNNFRTKNNYEWRTVVHHFMDVVPVIVVDTSDPTEHIAAELLRIENRGFRYKTITYGVGPPTPGFLDSGYDLGAVLKTVDRLADVLEPKITEHLAELDDIRLRANAQSEYTAMIASAPFPVRFNSDINAMLIKAHYILAWSMAGYLRECKGILDPESVTELA